MKTTNKIAAGLALLGFAASANAAFINGAIGFGSSAGGSNTTWSFIGTCTTTANCNGFNLNPDTNNATVSDAQGDLSGLLGATATLSDVDISLLPISPQWTVGGYTFDLESATVLSVVNTGSFKLLAMRGKGTINGPGFQPSAGVWDWTGSATGTSSNIAFSFNSNTASIPEPTTLGLLAVGLLGAGAGLRRKQKAA